MLIPHFVFSHMLADYTLQTNWLAVRKAKTWNGLFIHGFVVFLFTSLLIPRDIGVVWPIIVAISIVHTIQDTAKVRLTPYLKVHPVYSYFADQFLHLLLIFLVQPLFVGQITIPSLQESLFMAVGAGFIAVTRAYDVSWWANYFPMLPYMKQWEIWSYIERMVMLAFSATGLFFIAPLCVLPRLLWSDRIEKPIWRERFGLAEMLVGIPFCILLGFWIHTINAV